MAFTYNNLSWWIVLFCWPCFCLRREKLVLCKVVNFGVDVSVHTDLSIPKGCKFAKDSHLLLGIIYFSLWTQGHIVCDYHPNGTAIRIWDQQKLSDCN